MTKHKLFKKAFLEKKILCVVQYNTMSQKVYGVNIRVTSYPFIGHGMDGPWSYQKSPTPG